ncbi:MAG: A24 family peptidase [Acidimicrobiia bacterium]
MTTAELVILCAVLGLCVGSFANVVIWRVPRGESIVSPGSRCPSCGCELRAGDNIPVLSWLLLRGRCRRCSAPISSRYPIVEALIALLWVAAALRFGLHVAVAPYALFFTTLVVLSAVDLDTMRVPNKILYPSGVLCTVALVVAAVFDHRADDLARAAIGAVIGFAALLLIHLVRPDGMGFGDVRLAFLLGGMLGFTGLGYTALGLFGGFLLGAVVGSIAIATGHGAFGRRVPFAPYLAAGSVLALLFGRPVVDWYSGLFG